MIINFKAIIFFKLEPLQKKTLFKKIFIYLLFTITIFFPTKGSPFDNPLAKNSSGVNSSHIIKSDNFSLNARNVKVLTLQNNSLWIGTSMGILKYDTSSVESYTLYDNRNSLLSNGIFSITIGPTKQIWAGTYGGGISVMSKNMWTNINTPHGLNDSFVYDIEFTQDSMWVATWSGVNRVQGDPLKRDSWTSYTVKNTSGGLIDNWVYAIEIGKDNNIWFGTEGGLSLFNGKKWSNWNHKKGLGAPHEIVKSDNKFATATFKGTHHSNQATDLPNTENISYRPNYIVSMHLDQLNRLWIGTWGAGLSVFNPETQIFRNYTVTEGLPGNYILSIKEGPNGNIWIGSNKGLSMFDGSTFLNYSKSNGLISDYVFSIEFDTDNFLWVGGHHGMNKLKLDINTGALIRKDS